MDALLARHSKEAQALQTRIAQKKQAATKKTRKAVADECARLERDQQQRHGDERAAATGPAEENGPAEEHVADGTAAADDDDGPPREGQPEAVSSGGRDEEVEAAAAALGALALSEGGTEAAPARTRRPNRQKARLARRAAEREELARRAEAEAEGMPDMKEREREAMVQQFRREGLAEREVRADGHCLYAAVADGLAHSGLQLRPRAVGVEAAGEDYRTVRRVAANYMEKHPDEFAPFLGEGIESYVKRVRDTGEWGGQIELMALAKAYGVDISVLQGDGNTIDIEGENKSEGKTKLWLAYYRHNFGLGEHYNSLRKQN